MAGKSEIPAGTEKSGKDLPAAKSGEFRIGGDLPVWRLGFGAMRITGKGVWGEPQDHHEAIRVLRRAVELGINWV
jgi:pyridoxine 4-dehydrogenase